MSGPQVTMTAKITHRAGSIGDSPWSGLITRSTTNLREIVPGLVAAAFAAVAATSLGQLLPVIGGPVFGIVLGIAAGVAIASGVTGHSVADFKLTDR